MIGDLYIVLFVLVAFALGVVMGRVSMRPRAPVMKPIILDNEQQDKLFDQLEVLRNARFAPPMTVSASTPVMPPKVSNQAVAFRLEDRARRHRVQPGSPTKTLPYGFGQKKEEK